MKQQKKTSQVYPCQLGASCVYGDVHTNREGIVTKVVCAFQDGSCPKAVGWQAEKGKQRKPEFENGKGL